MAPHARLIGDTLTPEFTAAAVTGTRDCSREHHRRIGGPVSYTHLDVYKRQVPMPHDFPPAPSLWYSSMRDERAGPTR